MPRAVAAVALGAALAPGARSQSGPGPDMVVLDLTRVGPPVPPTLFELFFEDINFAADGGLHPERVKNRSIEFTEPLAAWGMPWRPEADGELLVRSEGGMSESNPHYLPSFGAVNSDFRGMGVEAGAGYVLSAYVRAHPGGPGSLSARLTGDRGALSASGTLAGFGGEWKRYETTLRPTATHARAELEVTATEVGEIDIDVVSLSPRGTWRGRPHGLRKDLVQLLADLKPGFLRFPGGCIVEGRRLALRYDWKETVGDPAERPTLVNRWNDEFAHRAAPDLVEFANGPVESPWGGLRARMGHPEPFGMRMIGIGNEQWGPRYVERYKRFATVLKKAHPEVALVASAGPAAGGPMFDYLWTNLRRFSAEPVDEHDYMPPAWFLANARRYDTDDRLGPKVFAGEYAAQTSGQARSDNRNNWEAALAEAAFITGLERNPDVVLMSSYAPLLAHVDAWQWTPDLIWFDNLRSCGTPSYYVQKTYATNQGSHILPLAANGSERNAVDGLYTSASIDRRSSELVLKAVNATSSARRVRVEVEGAGRLRGEGRLLVLASDDLAAENDLEQPTRVSPVESRVAPAAFGFDPTLLPHSLTVLRAGFSS